MPDEIAKPLFLIEDLRSGRSAGSCARAACSGARSGRFDTRSGGGPTRDHGTRANQGETASAFGRSVAAVVQETGAGQALRDIALSNGNAAAPETAEVGGIAPIGMSLKGQGNDGRRGASDSCHSRSQKRPFGGAGGDAHRLAPEFDGGARGRTVIRSGRRCDCLQILGQIRLRCRQLTGHHWMAALPRLPGSLAAKRCGASNWRTFWGLNCSCNGSKLAHRPSWIPALFRCAI